MLGNSVLFDVASRFFVVWLSRDIRLWYHRNYPDFRHRCIA